MSDGRQFGRRDVLRVAAATGLLGGTGVGVASGAPSDRHVVGTNSEQTAQKAKQMADSVHREFDFGAIGAAVAGRFPKQAREALQKNPNVRYVEPDGQLQAIGQSLPWGVDRTDADLTTADAETSTERFGPLRIFDEVIEDVDLVAHETDIARIAGRRTPASPQSYESATTRPSP